MHICLLGFHGELKIETAAEAIKRKVHFRTIREIIRNVENASSTVFHDCSTLEQIFSTKNVRTFIIFYLQAIKYTYKYYRESKEDCEMKQRLIKKIKT